MEWLDGEEIKAFGQGIQIIEESRARGRISKDITSQVCKRCLSFALEEDKTSEVKLR